ncbi:MAG: hypothetical protein Q8N70_07665 [Deltaproteobacteria bacterium]|nr:hypothetical protein [Deltaproteobacteria bacterium]
MKQEGHLQKANEIKASLQKLLPDPEGKNVVAIVELTYGVVQHLIAAGMERIHHIHSDTHVGLPHLLRDHGEDELASVFERLDFFRQGRWYGGKGNGGVVRECLEIIEKIERWVQG